MLENPRRATLLLLGVASIFAIWHGTQADPGPDRRIAACALGLGGSAIVLRRASQANWASERSALAFGWTTLLASFGLGLLGAWSAWHDHTGRTGLLFVLAGVLFTIRPFRRPGAD